MLNRLHQKCSATPDFAGWARAARKAYKLVV
jgi:hypothetical protein